MSDKATESGQEQTEIESVPAPKTSQASGDSSISSGGVDEQAILSRLESRIEQEVEKRVQSLKDKRIGKLEKQVEGYGDLLGQLKGVLPDDVLNEHAERIQQAEDRKIIRQLWEQQNQPQQASESVLQGNAEWAKTQKALQGVFERKGLLEADESFENSRAYIEFYKANKGEWNNMSEVERLARAYDYADVKAGSQKGVSAGVVAQPPGGGAQRADGDELINNYIKEMMDNRGNKTAIVSVQKKYRDLGVPIEQVAFH